VDVTIAVCTYNRADRLRRALQSLQQIELPAGKDVELLVVDNASTDQTPDVAASFADADPIPVRYTREPAQGVAHARNRAVREAAGEWIAFFDDDQLADRRWLVELLETAERHDCGFVGGAVRLNLPESAAPLAGACRVLLTESPADQPEAPYSGPRTPGAGNLLARKSLLERAGGFDPHATMGGEDTALFREVKRLGEQVWFGPRAVIYHVVPAERLRPNYLLWNARRTGVHIADIELQHYGPVLYLARFSARLLQAAVKLPGLLCRSRVSRDAAVRLGAECVLAAGAGYARRVGQHYAAGLIPQRDYFSKLDFRSEREQFGT
jgi:glycosyltransferase involved in cell wall biosynthesis